jgi:hypothetical protein
LLRERQLDGAIFGRDGSEIMGFAADIRCFGQGGSDLEGVEGRRGGGADGLGLLPVATRFLSSKGDPPGLPAETPRACCFEVMRSTAEGHSQLATTKTGALLAPKTRLGPMAILIRTTGPPRPLSSAP